MEHRISAGELKKRLSDVLAKIRERGDSYVIERDGDPVAHLIPPPGKAGSSLGEALAAWRAAGEPDTGFADDLERIGAADLPPEDAWAS